MTRPFFSKDRISHFETIDVHAADAIKQIKARMKQGYAVDVQVSVGAIHRQLFLTSIQDAVARFTLDSAAESFLGMFVFPFEVSRRLKYSQSRFSGTFVHSQPGWIIHLLLPSSPL